MLSQLQITNKMALLIGYLKRGDETSAEADWVEWEVWRAISLAVASTDDNDSPDVDDDLPVVHGLSAEGRLPENASDHVSKYVFPERSSEDYAARDVAQVWFGRSSFASVAVTPRRLDSQQRVQDGVWARDSQHFRARELGLIQSHNTLTVSCVLSCTQATLNASRPEAARVAPSPTPTAPSCRFVEARVLKNADVGDAGGARASQQPPSSQSVRALPHAYMYSFSQSPRSVARIQLTHVFNEGVVFRPPS